MVYRYCVVPECKNTTVSTPAKTFVKVPMDEKRRNIWLEAARRGTKDVSAKSNLLICEDHFNLEEDMENYMEWKMMGVQKRMKKDVVPHKFACRSDRKPTIDCSVHNVVLKHARFEIVQNALRDQPSTSKTDLPIEEDKPDEQSEQRTEDISSCISIAMENEIAVEQAFDVGKVKIETADCDGELFANKDDSCEYTDKTISNRIKKEHNDYEAWIECDVQNREILGMQTVNIKLEKDMDTDKLEVKEIADELILKNEHDFDTSVDKYSEIVLNRISHEYEVEDKPELVKIEEMDLEMWKDVDIKTCQDTDVAQLDHNHSNANAKPSIFMNRMKNEHNDSEAWIKCDVQNREILGMKPVNIKLEKDMDTEKFEVEEISEELILKNEDDFDTSVDKHSEIVLNSINHECEVEDKAELVKIEEIDLEMWKDVDMENCQDTDAAQFDHNHSNANAKSSIFMNSSEEQKIARKRHNVVRKGASRKSFSCFNCSYTTSHKYHLIDHMKQHNADSLSSRHKHCICTHCKARFKSKASLDNHTIEKHPDSIAPISDKIHKCIDCTYATSSKSSLARHMLKHPETAGHPETSRSYKCITCIHCNATFKTKVGLDDHTIRKHPDFIASVSRKIHKCTHCTYKTTRKDCLDKHMSQHPETTGNYKFRTCIHCNATFKSKVNLDNHTIRKHPDFIASVSRKIHKCTHCTYKTIKKDCIDKHMLQHPETAGSYKLSTCIHCNATFKNKVSLDEHTIRKHPDFIASVSRKIHKCPHCTFSTTLKTNKDKHMSQHPETAESYKLTTCVHCNATFKGKVNLDEHTIRKHPDFIASVSRRIHKCPHCTYATTLKTNIDKHMLQHPETAESYKISTCIHCNATFRSKVALDDHTFRKHPDFIASVSRKIHKCPHCTYATTWKTNIDKHMLQHRETF